MKLLPFARTSGSSSQLLDSRWGSPFTRAPTSWTHGERTRWTHEWFRIHDLLYFCLYSIRKKKEQRKKMKKKWQRQWKKMWFWVEQSTALYLFVYKDKFSKSNPNLFIIFPNLHKSCCQLICVHHLGSGSGFVEYEG